MNRIAELNDAFRRSLSGGQVMITASVAALPTEVRSAAVDALRAFDTFTRDNDPYGEHDFGAFELEGERFFFKIDYYAPDLNAASEDPADPEKTVRVLTLMLAADY